MYASCKGHKVGLTDVDAGISVEQDHGGPRGQAQRPPQHALEGLPLLGTKGLLRLRLVVGGWWLDVEEGPHRCGGVSTLMYSYLPDVVGGEAGDLRDGLRIGFGSRDHVFLAAGATF